MPKRLKRNPLCFFSQSRASPNYRTSDVLGFKLFEPVAEEDTGSVPKSPKSEKSRFFSAVLGEERRPSLILRDCQKELCDCPFVLLGSQIIPPSLRHPKQAALAAGVALSLLRIQTFADPAISCWSAPPRCSPPLRPRPVPCARPALSRPPPRGHRCFTSAPRN